MLPAMLELDHSIRQARLQLIGELYALSQHDFTAWKLIKTHLPYLAGTRRCAGVSRVARHARPSIIAPIMAPARRFDFSVGRALGPGMLQLQVIHGRRVY